MKKIFTLIAAFSMAAVSYAQNAIPGTLDLKTADYTNATVAGNEATEESDAGVWRLNNIRTGDVVAFQLASTEAQAYEITFKQGTCMSGLVIDFEIVDANSQVVYTKDVDIENTNPESVNFEVYTEQTVGTTDVLPAGNYTLKLYYNRDGVNGTYQGTEFNFTCNVSEIKFSAVAGGSSEPSADKVAATLDAAANNADANTTASWAFANDYFISNTAGSRTYSAAGNFMKFSRNYEFVIEIPETVTATAVEFEGYTNGAWEGDGNQSYSFIGKFDGKTFNEKTNDKTLEWMKNRTATYGFPANDEKDGDGNQRVAIHKLTLDTPKAGAEIPFEFWGTSQVCAIIRIYVADTATGIESVQTFKLDNGAIYNLSGQKVGSDYKGIVIKGGKKFVIK